MNVNKQYPIHSTIAATLRIMSNMYMYVQNIEKIYVRLNALHYWLDDVCMQGPCSIFF